MGQVQQAQKPEPTQDRRLAFNKENERYRAKKKEILQLKGSHPQQFAAEYEQYLVDLEHLVADYSDVLAGGIPNDVLNGYIGLAHFVRFTLRRPERALALYQKIEQLSTRKRVTGLSITEFASFRLADIYQYDLHDKANAIRHYERFLQVVSGQEDDEAAALQGWLSSWLENETRYLKTGKPFSGVITNEQLIGFSLIMVFISEDVQRDRLTHLDTGLKVGENIDVHGADQGLDRRDVLRRLRKLSRSHFILASTVPAVSYLPTPESIVAYLESQDPGRYWSATILSWASLQEDLYGEQSDQESVEPQYPRLLPGAVRDRSGNPSPIRLAADLFWRKTGIRFDRETRFTSPDEVWQVFSAAIVKGDIEQALKYMTPETRGRYRELLKQLSQEQVRRRFSDAQFRCLRPITEEDRYLECEVGVEEKEGAGPHGTLPAGRYSYPIIVVKNWDGVWRINRF